MLTFRADAHAVKPAVGNEQVYWVLTVSVDKMDEFKSLVGKLVAATEKEPGAMQYEYNVGNDHKTVDILRTLCRLESQLVSLDTDLRPEFFQGILCAVNGACARSRRRGKRTRRLSGHLQRRGGPNQIGTTPATGGLISRDSARANCTSGIRIRR